MIQSSADSSRPTAEQFGKELKRRVDEMEFRKIIISAAQTLAAFAAVAVLLSTLLLPVFSVHKNSMTPTLLDGELLIFSTVGEIKRGDIIAFHYNNQVLIKRVIATAGESVDINEDGVVYINEAPLSEPYINSQSLGECDLELPLMVPERQYFVMGDNRYISTDSRVGAIGTINSEHIVGKAILRIWPIPKIRFM